MVLSCCHRGWDTRWQADVNLLPPSSFLLQRYWLYHLNSAVGFCLLGFGLFLAWIITFDYFGGPFPPPKKNKSNSWPPGIKISLGFSGLSCFLFLLLFLSKIWKMWKQILYMLKCDLLRFLNWGLLEYFEWDLPTQWDYFSPISLGLR